jgi:hypothetical protein
VSFPPLSKTGLLQVWSMSLAKAHVWSCLALSTVADTTPAHILTGSYIEQTDAAAVATGTLSRSAATVGSHEHQLCEPCCGVLQDHSAPFERVPKPESI